MDRNSIRNQRIKEKFVDREVHACVSGMVEYILRKSQESFDNDIPFTYDDIENMYIDNNKKIEELQEQIENLQEQIDESETELEENEKLDNSLIADRKNQIKNLQEEITEIEDKIEELETEQEEPQEAYEWWVVSNWLGEKLKAHNKIIINDGFNIIWGRDSSGQAIKLDDVISNICEELGILEGQKNEWEI